jgi:RsiW-degrading membrane proteinase PrsW (M82 family)
MNWQIITFLTIVILAFTPFWIVPLAILFGADTSHNSPWAAVPWLIFYTVPAGLVALLVWLAVVIYQSMRG